MNSQRERSPCSSPTSRDRRRLLQRVGERYADVLEACRHLLRTAFHQYHGHEVDTQGDAFFVAFARATDASRAAVAAQRCPGLAGLARGGSGARAHGAAHR